MQYTPSRNPLAHACTVADAAARHALTTVSPVKQADTGHLHVFLGGDIASEADWMDLGHYNVAPSNTAVPTISGTVQVDAELTAVAGTYAGYPAPSHASWQWQISDTGTNGWSDISGATSSTYMPVSGDGDKYLRVKEGQSNSLGTVYAYSAATEQVTTIAVPGKPDVPTLSGSSYWAEGYVNVYWQHDMTSPAMPANATAMFIQYSFFGGAWESDNVIEPSTNITSFATAANSECRNRIHVTGPGGDNYSDPTETFYAPA